MRHLLALCLLLAGCAAVKPIARTINDIARDACELFAADNQDRLKFSPQEFCALHDNLDPFIQDLLAAQRMAAQRAGIAKP